MHSSFAVILPLLAATVVQAAPMKPKIDIWDSPWKGASCSGHDCSIKREALKLPPGPGEQSPWFKEWTHEGPLDAREAKQEPPSGKSPWFAPWNKDDGPITESGKHKDPSPGETPWFAPWSNDDGPISKREASKEPPSGDSPWFAPWNEDNGPITESGKPKAPPPGETPWYAPWNIESTDASKREAYMDRDITKQSWVKLGNGQRRGAADDEEPGKKLWGQKWA